LQKVPPRTPSLKNSRVCYWAQRTMKVLAFGQHSVAAPRRSEVKSASMRHNLEGRLISPPNLPIRGPVPVAAPRGLSSEPYVPDTRGMTVFLRNGFPLHQPLHREVSSLGLFSTMVS